MPYANKGREFRHGLKLIYIVIAGKYSIGYLKSSKFSDDREGVKPKSYGPVHKNVLILMKKNCEI